MTPDTAIAFIPSTDPERSRLFFGVRTQPGGNMLPLTQFT